MKAFCLTLVATGFLCGCKGMRHADSIPIIDTHIHLYDTTRPEGLPWPPPSDTVLYRPILPSDFDQVCEANQVTATVIVVLFKSLILLCLKQQVMISSKINLSTH